MYILINNIPVDIFKINRITQVYPLTLEKYDAAVLGLGIPPVDNLKKGKVDNEHKSETNIILRIIEHVLKEVYHLDISKLSSDQRIFSRDLNPTSILTSPLSFRDKQTPIGYYFGIEPYEGAMFISSKIYKTKEEADKSLKSLLELINTVRNNLISEIEI